MLINVDEIMKKVEKSHNLKQVILEAQNNRLALYGEEIKALKEQERYMFELIGKLIEVLEEHEVDIMKMAEEINKLNEKLDE